MAIDLFDLVFREILQISPRLISQYSTTQDQLIFLLLIPHVILFLFIYAFSRGLVTRILGEAKGSFTYLLSIVMYIFIIFTGWYGVYLIPLFITWWYVVLFVGLVLFAVSAFFAPGRISQAKKFTSAAAETIASKTVGVSEKKKILNNEITLMDDQIRVYEKEKSKAMRQGRPDSASYFDVKVGELKAQKKALENELTKL